MVRIRKFYVQIYFSAIVSIGCCLSACNDTATLFTSISPRESGIHFANTVSENDSVNPIDLEFLYNGGGVAVGDFNNDNLPDLYFTASTASNKLYLNKGKLEFKDITEQSVVTGEGRWCSGASVVDINQDGWQDIYISASIKKNAADRKNLLYINQGLNQDGVPSFKELAAAYRLDDTSFSVHSAFFDYDNDGDLDMYLVTTKLAERDANEFLNNNVGDTSRTDMDRLFRNDWSDSLKHPVFTDVSVAAGIDHHGYGLGMGIADINKDGWKDIYVTNDFYGSDLLYINNKNGGFTNKISNYFKHTSQNAMGNDIADINNDGLADVFAVDMNPRDNFRKKKNMNSSNYYIYQNMIYGNYMLQYVRNTLQLNQGPVIQEGDSIGDPIFSEIGFFSDLAETDWSWNPSLADFDNDGLRDIIITNGYPRDVTDHDFAAFRQHASQNVSKKELIGQMPIIKISNYAFKNNDSLQFTNVTESWGMNEPSFSNGAVYVDLDNDGDLDYVINNINEKATLYRNNKNTSEKINGNFLTVRFKGSSHNRDGLGAVSELYYDSGKMQVYENSPYRGYLSTVDRKAFFGLGAVKRIDSLIVKWPGGKQQVLKGVDVNQELTVNIAGASLNFNESAVTIHNNLFTDVTRKMNISYKHEETDFIDFDHQRLLPHKLSQYGPALAAGDIDGNGLDDIIIGGTGDFPAYIFLQQTNKTFISAPLPLATGSDARRPENMGILLFDIENDGDLDLYIANGSSEFAPNTKNFQDRLYLNDGKGKYSLADSALPINYTSKSCIKAHDIDQDGDLDLFIGGRVLPGSYPMPVGSMIYRNDSRPGKPRFTDVTGELAKELLNIGLVCDAVWTDFDNDGMIDLIVVGEWMPISFFKNIQGKFSNISRETGLQSYLGWWNSIAAGDFDNDGDMDYVAGNLGKNSFYRASVDHPVRIYGKDFDKNQRYDIVPTLYLPDADGTLKEFPANNRDEMIDQLPGLKKRFLTYSEFGKAELKDIFFADELQDALKLEANYFENAYIVNRGNGKFTIQALPQEAQFGPIYGLVVEDVDGDGNLDIGATGNDFGTEVSNGRYDALNGLLMCGDGKGNFKSQPILQSGIFLPGDGKALVKLAGLNHDFFLAGSQNRGSLKIFKKKQVKQQKIIRLHAGDQMVFFTLKNGDIRKEELVFGNSFLSQSSRFVTGDINLYNKIEVVNNKGVRRIIQ